MNSNNTAKSRPKGGLPDKRRAILTGALTVFARDGFTRASIDAISSEAGVSTRTIYNHFQDKTQLFETVIQESAAHAAAHQIDIIDRYLRKVTDVEADLTEFGVAWVTPSTATAAHSALVRQINAELGHIPQPAIDAWQETGPLRVRRELATRLKELADRGLLAIVDGERAALHFSLLISGSLPTRVGNVTESEITESVTSGVRAFLHGYLR